MDDEADLEDSIRDALRRGQVHAPNGAFTARVMAALPNGHDVRQRRRLIRLGALALSAVVTVAAIRAFGMGIDTPVPGGVASAPGESSWSTPPSPATAASITPSTTEQLWELVVPRPAGWLVAINGTRDDFSGQNLFPVGSLGTVPVQQSCDLSGCATTWDQSAEIQIRVEHVGGARKAWGQWQMVSKEPPPGAERITIDGVGAQVRVVDGNRVPDTEEIVAGAARIIVWDLPTPGSLTMSYRITAVIRADAARVESLDAQVTQVVENIRYSPQFRWELPLDDPVGALQAGLRPLRDQASRSETMDASCFPDAPGTTREVVIEKVAFLPFELTRPLAVTCSSAIEPTEFRRWKMTLRYDWQAMDEYDAGHAEMIVLLDKTHGVVGYYGDFFGVEEMPYVRRR